ncbi:MAG: hypothetical protein JKP96_00605 [Oceanicaulis sp.]|jgi:hypothetical protein|nr:hypothetical protein [Oceanicaulis sp.]
MTVKRVQNRRAFPLPQNLDIETLSSATRTELREWAKQISRLIKMVEIDEETRVHLIMKIEDIRAEQKTRSQTCSHRDRRTRSERKKDAATLHSIAQMEQSAFGLGTKVSSAEDLFGRSTLPVSGGAPGSKR